MSECRARSAIAVTGSPTATGLSGVSLQLKRIPRQSWYSALMRPDLLRGHLDRLLLAVLLGEPGHGYAVSQRLDQRSAGTFRVPEGSLYPALQRLERAALVTSTWSVVDGRRRRVYRLLPAGKDALSASTTEWQLFSGAVDRVIAGPA